jgi:hypothetical protein
VRENKFKAQTSAGQVMASVFWDNEGMLLVELLKRGATINSGTRAEIKDVKTTNSKGSNRKTNQVIILHTTLI